MTTPRPEIGEDLTRFRYHTGATLRPLAPDEPCRLLFRDVGPQAMALFLRGKLTRLAGPYAPILYARTADYREPYVDHEPIGRLVFLQPHAIRPWHSGVPTIFVASLRQSFDPRAVGFVPAHLSLSEAERRLHGVGDVAALREAFGGRSHDEVVAETLAGLDWFNADFAEGERAAEPLRRQLQSRCREESGAAREWLAAHDLRESDLCTAYHHLPRARRALLRDALRDRAGVKPC